MALEGLVLRLATLLALYICPRGITLEPVVVAVGSLWNKMRGCVQRKPKKRTVTASGPGNSV